jgi:hypothetical protein
MVERTVFKKTVDQKVVTEKIVTLTLSEEKSDIRILSAKERAGANDYGVVTVDHAKDKVGLGERVETVKRYPFFSLDEKQYAALILDLKNIDTANASVGNDWKLASKTTSISRTYHLGPSVGLTNTFDYNPPLAVPQNADLGPTVDSVDPPDPRDPGRFFSTIYHRSGPYDKEFYCYKSLYSKTSQTNTLEQAADDIQLLVAHQDPAAIEHVQFTRIYVGPITLAKWLQNMAAELAENQNTVFPTGEAVLNGQLVYTFTLDVKPAMDIKYTFAATVINPFVPDLSGGQEHSTMFSIYLNNEQAPTALAAKLGTACNASIRGANCKPK